jgi:hypothetical protein
VGLQDNFLDLGGHSLLMMQVIFQVEQQIGARLYPADLFAQTLGQLANLCEERMPPGFKPENENLPPSAASPTLLKRVLRFGRSMINGR